MTIRWPRSVAPDKALALGLAASLLHLAICLTVLLHYHTGLANYTDKGDGGSYKHMALAILGDKSQMETYDTRVFVGYPILIAAVHLVLRLPIAISALAVTFISAGAAATFATLLFDDVRVGFATAFLLPHVWINQSLAMSEAPVLALTVAGLLLAHRRFAIAAGITLGMAILTRPVAGFALVALLVQLAGRQATNRDRLARWRPLIVSVFAAAVVLAGLWLTQKITGGMLANLKQQADSPRTYGGQPFTWPFHALLSATFSRSTNFWHWLYIALHVVIALGGCLLLLESNSDRDRLALPWLVGNTLFVLCVGSGSGGWGFNHFPRFMIPALPPLAWAWRRFLPAPRSAVYKLSAIFGGWLMFFYGVVLFFMAVIEVHGCP